MTYRVTFWGARGSIPTPGAGTVRYGGNTPCVQLDTGNGGTVILDAGTGIRALGRRLLREANGRPVQADILVSHTHWDHIHGLPFFAPIFEEGNQVRIWGAQQEGSDLETILRDQMRPVVFPVPLDDVSANLSVTHVGPEGFEVEGFSVRSMPVRHPGNTLGYVLTPAAGGPQFGYVTDNELTGGSYRVGPGWREEFVGFLRGVDVLVHDAMFTQEELPRYAGWGHSSNVEAVELANEAGVGRLVLFHHSPEHDDSTIDAIIDESAETAHRLGGGVEVIAAREGLELKL